MQGWKYVNIVLGLWSCRCWSLCGSLLNGYLHLLWNFWYWCLLDRYLYWSLHWSLWYYLLYTRNCCLSYLLCSWNCSIDHTLGRICYSAKHSSNLTKKSSRLWSWRCCISCCWNRWFSSLPCERIRITRSFCDKSYNSFYKFFQKSFNLNLWRLLDCHLYSCCWGLWHNWCHSWCRLYWGHGNLNWLNCHLHLWWYWSSCISYKIVWISRCLCRDLCLYRIHFFVLFRRTKYFDTLQF